jgi:hypothetical protein
LVLCIGGRCDSLDSHWENKRNKNDAWFSIFDEPTKRHLLRLQVRLLQVSSQLHKYVAIVSIFSMFFFTKIDKVYQIIPKKE